MVVAAERAWSPAMTDRRGASGCDCASSTLALWTTRSRTCCREGTLKRPRLSWLPAGGGARSGSWIRCSSSQRKSGCGKRPGEMWSRGGLEREPRSGRGPRTRNSGIDLAQIYGSLSVTPPYFIHERLDASTIKDLIGNTGVGDRKRRRFRLPPDGHELEPQWSPWGPREQMAD